MTPEKCACGNEAVGRAVSTRDETPICSACIAKSLKGEDNMDRNYENNMAETPTDAYLHAHDIPQSTDNLKHALGRLIQIRALIESIITIVSKEITNKGYNDDQPSKRSR